MNSDHFQKQMTRLNSNFPPYRLEFTQILWENVRQFEDSFMTKLVTQMISRFHPSRAPMLPDFEPFITEERDRLAIRRKEEAMVKFSDVDRCLPHQEEKERFKIITGRMLRRVSDEEWEAYWRSHGGLPKGY